MPPKTIILVKKSKGHAGHHGGAWKVAYADFVTALMALFIVLWLMNTNPQVRKAVAGYFNDPLSSSKLTGTDRSGSADNLPITKDNIKHLKERLEKSVHQLTDLRKFSHQIEITVTPEGLRIELLETTDGSFFDTGSAVLNARGREILTLLAEQLGTVPNRISIEGHTDARPYTGSANYDNWDLSTDRANAARRLMQAKGLRANQVSQVRGYADQDLRIPSKPFDPSNRRISLIVQYLNATPASAPDAPEHAAAAGGPASSAKPSPAVPLNGKQAPNATKAVNTKQGVDAKQAASAKQAAPAKKPVAAEAASGGLVSKFMDSRLVRKMRGH